MTETKVTRKDGSSIIFVSTGIAEKYLQSITDFQNVFDNETLKPLFDALFKRINKIFLLDSKSNYDELIAKGMDKNKNGFDFVIESIDGPTRRIDGIQCDNFIGFGQGYLAENPTPKSFFATLVHELVHCIDQLLTCDSCIFSKLDMKGKDIFNKNIEKFIEIAQTEKGKGNPCFQEVNIEHVQKLDHEKLTYCVQTYVLAFLIRDPIVSEISDLVIPIINICDEFIKKCP